MTPADVEPLEFLYGVDEAGPRDEPFSGYVVVPFRIVRKTARRIFYVSTWPPGKLRYVDRQAMEAAGDEGHWARRTASWWEPDNRLWLKAPTLHRGLRVNTAAAEAEVSRLRAEMAAVHPDRGGTDAEFIAAHRRYEAARLQGAKTGGGD